MKCCSAETNPKEQLTRPGLVGIAARISVSLLVFVGASRAFQGGGLWLVVAFPLAAFGVLLVVAAVTRQPGCEVNLIWSRLLRRTPVNCFLFGPIDRWEQRSD